MTGLVLQRLLFLGFTVHALIVCWPQGHEMMIDLLQLPLSISET